MRTRIEFLPAVGPVREPVPKLGGQPVWLEAPQWPLSRDMGTPMWFIGQFPLPADVGPSGALAYVFMTDAARGADYSAEPEGGENAVIVQPGGRLPRLQRAYRDTPTRIPVCSDADGPTIGPDHVMVEQPFADAERAMQFLGGQPEWLQAEDLPAPGWRLIVQLHAMTLPLQVSFGDAGVGYAFVDPTGIEGRLLWQGH
ncbi:hypothetical protein Dvina_26495 [Dactylosporangium vinaceum]|nr:hypothetical protein Dvina_26495 [Dactylosporangium vinaceum]